MQEHHPTIGSSHEASAPPASPALNQALAGTATWPANTVAAVIIDESGSHLATVGDSTRPFPLASVTKIFTATAALVAVEEGTIALDEPAGPPSSTVAHLLAHAAGLGPDGAVLCPPGQRRIYTNAGFELLATHLAKRANMPFDRYFTEAVCEPLGLKHSHLVASPAAGVTATAADVGALMRAWLVPGVLLAEETLALATSNQFGDLAGVLPGYGSQPHNSWGLGVEIRGDKSPHWTGSHNSPATFGHFGQLGSFAWADPALRVSLVVLTDRAFGPWAHQPWPALSDAVIDVLRGVRPTP